MFKRSIKSALYACFAMFAIVIAGQTQAQTVPQCVEGAIYNPSSCASLSSAYGYVWKQYGTSKNRFACKDPVNGALAMQYFEVNNFNVYTAKGSYVSNCTQEIYFYYGGSR